MTDKQPWIIVVTDVEEHEDGGATYTFDIDEEAQVELAKLGIEFVLYCAAYELDLQYVLDNLGIISKRTGVKEELGNDDNE